MSLINPNHPLAAPMAAALSALGWTISRCPHGRIYIDMRGARDVEQIACALEVLFLSLINIDKEILA